MSFLDILPRPFFVLAPMDDVTDTVFRQVIAELAPPDLFLTEFVNVDGLQSPGREKLLHKLRFTDKERPIFAQLWGLKPENFKKTAGQIKETGFDGVDLNFGCPVKTVIKNGACAALINNRELAGDIIEATREGVGANFPISVKTRVGFTTVDLSWIEFLLSKKLNMLSIHGRTAKELSKIPANWELIGDIRKMRDATYPASAEASAGRPATLIVGNGDVTSRTQGLKLIKKYGLDGIMVGRGVFHDPLAFAADSSWGSWTKQQKIDLFKRHIKLFDKTWNNGERKIETLNKFCKVYINGFEGAKELREELMRCTSAKDLLAALA